ncbi:MAG: hypothetical protein HQL13_06520 [Candidatus Omnitrophica bacterium]|nr:hypothetical protein [Candidatus Omnitrophota bacterium]
MTYQFTEYFENEVLRKRPYISKKWCVAVIKNPVRVEHQEDNRYRFWGTVIGYEGKYLRVITLEDQMTIHNAFFDRRFKI